MLAALTTLALVSSAACTDRSAEAPATPTVAATVVRAPTSEDVLPTGDPGVTVENVILACREKDGDLLRSFVAGAVPREALQALFARGTDVLLKGRTLAHVEDGRATVAVRLEVRRDGEIDTVDRSWELEQGADGVWRFTALPDCF